MHQRQSSPTVNTSKQNLSPTRLPFWTGCGFGGTSSRFVNVPMTLVPCVFSVRSNRVTVSGYLPSGSSFCGCPLKAPAHVPLKSARDAGSARESRSIDENKRTTFQRTLQCGASQVLDESLLAQNDNVLIAQSRNVLLTRSGWGGGIRNTSHDATGPRSTDRSEESQEGADHPASSCRRDRTKRAAYPAAAGETEARRQPGDHSWTAGKTIQMQGQEKYRGFGPTLASEYLDKHHQITVSRETVRAWMIEARLWQSRKQKVAKVHLWRQRRSRCGELVQWDTSEHAWLEERGPKLYLISMIDDATSRLHARFVLHDSTAENMRLLWSYLERYGRPVSFYTDKASLFQTAPKIARDVKELPRDERAPLPPTQIGRALAEMGIVWIAAHSPQAKGRVERSFQTAQDRLVK